MATLASLAIELTANSAKLVTEVKKANKTIDGFAKQAQNAGRLIKVAFGSVAVGALASMGREAIDTADKMGKLAGRLGATTEGLSELGYAAELSGVQFNTLSMGLQRMTRRVSEAAEGTGEARSALAELNLEATELRQLSPEQQFEQIAEQISKLANESDRVRVAMKLFDSEGVALVQTMSQGAAGIRAMRAEARKMGASISTEAAMSAAAFNDEMTRLNSRMDNFTRGVSIEAARAFVRIAEAIELTNRKSGEAQGDFSAVKNIILGLGTVAIGTYGSIAAIGEAYTGLTFAAAEFSKGNFAAALTEIEEASRRANLQLTEADNRIKKLWESSQQAPANDSGYETGGGTGGLSFSEQQQEKELEKTEQMLAKKLELIDSSHASENERLIEKLENELAISEHYAGLKNIALIKQETDYFAQLDELVNNSKLSEAEAELRQTKFLEKTAKQREKIEKDSAKRKQNIAKSYFMSALGEAATFSRAAFNIQKAAALADGAIKAKESILGAFAFGSKIGGPWVGAAFAAAAGVMAFAHLRAISQSQFGGGGEGSAPSPSVGSVSTSTQESEPVALDQSANDEERTKTVFINIEGIDDEAFLTKRQVRSIVDQINEEREANVKVVL